MLNFCNCLPTLLGEVTALTGASGLILGGSSLGIDRMETIQRKPTLVGPRRSKCLTVKEEEPEDLDHLLESLQSENGKTFPI